VVNGELSKAAATSGDISVTDQDRVDNLLKVRIGRAGAGYCESVLAEEGD
jgi:hypothetical protein